MYILTNWWTKMQNLVQSLVRARMCRLYLGLVMNLASNSDGQSITIRPRHSPMLCTSCNVLTRDESHEEKDLITSIALYATLLTRYKYICPAYTARNARSSRLQ